MTMSLADLPRASQPLRIVLTSSAGKPQQLPALGVAPLRKDAAAQSYAIRKKVDGPRTTYVVLGADPIGAMYGGLDLAEAIRSGTLATSTTATTRPTSPSAASSSTSRSMPARPATPTPATPPSRTSPRCGAWTSGANSSMRWPGTASTCSTLWNLHPFPSMVKVPEYPGRGAGRRDAHHGEVRRHLLSFSGSDMVRPAMLANLETVKKMTIDEKIRFWREVMQYAHDRGIEVYLFTWNIFTWGAEGKYGITSAQDNPTTIDYFRKSVRETLLTYPLLAGIGITAGENMQNLKGEFSKEKWLWKTYGEGIRDAKKLQPNRSIRLIHRFHQTSLRSDPGRVEGLPRHLRLQLQVLRRPHVLARPRRPSPQQTLAELPADLRTWMTVRNDDIYSFRWGDPEYARAYIRNLPGPGQAGRLLHGPRRLHLGPRVHQHRAGDAAPTGDQEAVVQLHALGPAELRSRPAGRALRAHAGRAFPEVAGAQALRRLVARPPRSSRRSRGSSGATSTSSGSPKPASAIPATRASIR